MLDGIGLFGNTYTLYIAHQWLQDSVPPIIKYFPRGHGPSCVRWGDGHLRQVVRHQPTDSKCHQNSGESLTRGKWLITSHLLVCETHVGGPVRDRLQQRFYFLRRMRLLLLLYGARSCWCYTGQSWERHQIQNCSMVWQRKTATNTQALQQLQCLHFKSLVSF